MLAGKIGYFRSPSDPASAWIAAVESRDGQALESGVRQAVRDFVSGCISDGIWSAIRSSCILAGARTLSGALVPLAGVAPTNVNFVSGDYNRKTGLVGNGTTKYLNTNRANNADGQNDRHLAVYASAIGTIEPGLYAGAGSNGTGCMNILQNANRAVFSRVVPQDSNSGTNGFNYPPQIQPGCFAVARYGANAYFVGYRSAGGFSANPQTTAGQFGNPSGTPTSDNVFVFARNNGSGTAQVPTNARLAFYSIGANIDLVLMNSRLDSLYAAIGAAIP